MPRIQKWIFPLLGFLLIAASVALADDIAQGRTTYLRDCASCHGLTGEGDGPVAPFTIPHPANLRRLWERYGNPLPADQIARFIDGRADVKSHGPRDMPVWGERFYLEEHGSERGVQNRIAKLVAYIQSIQAGTHQASLK
jgi:mono/diheme cytochrome c family protein